MSQQNQEATEVTSSSPAPAPPSIMEVFSKQREKYKEMITKMATTMRDVMHLADVQIELFTNRHITVDEIHRLLDIHAKLSEKYKQERSKALASISTEGKAVKHISEEVDSRTAETKKNMDTLSNQIDFFREVLRTFDSMLYGIKWRLDFETNYRRAS